MPWNSLHLISTGAQNPDEFVEKVLATSAHADYVHLRERGWSAQDHIAVINKLVQKGLPREQIIVNDRIDIAVTERLGGVQLGYRSISIQKAKRYFPDLKVGCSVHSVKEAIRQEKLGADYLLYGHIFETASKADATPRGLEELKRLATSVNIPVIAIGGIKPNHVQSVITTGASGVAVLSGVLLAEDSLDAVLKYRKELQFSEEDVKNELTY